MGNSADTELVYETSQ